MLDLPMDNLKGIFQIICGKSNAKTQIIATDVPVILNMD